MSIRYYDEAVSNKIKGWVRDKSVRILSPADSSRFFQMKADLKNDKPLTLPMIAISRLGGAEIINTNKRALTYDGGHLDATNEKSEVLNAIPIKIQYQLDIYTKYFAECDEYARNFIFNIINYPRIKIEIPYNDCRVEHNSTLLLESNIDDASDIPERLIAGQFYRMSLKIYIDDAYLFSVPFNSNWKVEMGEVEVREEKIN